jgi:nucleosome binding factor SPN SPT16 subunit
MADDIVIDKQLFHERLGSLVTKWKADKRSGDQLFQGATSIASVLGKPSDPGNYLKPAAFQVRWTTLRLLEHALTILKLWLLGYEFPHTLFILTPDLVQIVATKKKGKYGGIIR